MWNPFMQDPLVGPLVHGIGLGVLFPVIFIVFALWVFAWKAIALWHAGRNGQRIWFVVLLVVNTLGILEIIYLKWFQEVEREGNRDHIFPFIKDVRAKAAAQMKSSPQPAAPAAEAEEKKEEPKSE